MSELEAPEALNKKVGPLPLGVWGLAIAGGIGVAVFVRRKAQAAPVVVDGMPGDGSTPDVAGTTAPTVGNVWQPAPSNPYGTDLTVAGPTTNEEWGILATQRLILKGYNPLTVDAAVRRYLGGETLTTTDRAAIDEALRLCGPPPNQLPPPPNVPPATPHTPTPAPKPAPKPPVKKPAPKPPVKKPAPKPPVKKPAPAPKYVLHGTQHQGSTGASVKAVQKLVGATADGVYGPKTAAAVASWQRRHHLAADGVFGPKSAAAAGWGYVG